MLDPNICCHCKSGTVQVFSCKNVYYETICTHKYCAGCLSKFYGENAAVLENANAWICPAHRGICFCESCCSFEEFSRTKNVLKEFISSRVPSTKKQEPAPLFQIAESCELQSTQKVVESVPESLEVPQSVSELRTMNNSLTSALKRKMGKNVDAVQCEIQAALEFNTYALSMFEKNKHDLSESEVESTFITLWKNLNELAKSADLAAANGKVKNDTAVLRINEECENRKRGKGVQVNMKKMTIVIDKDVLLY